MAQGPTTFKIDQEQTFEKLLMLDAGPKTAFGDQYRQETTKDGTPKWEAEIAARFRSFGRAVNEIIKVGIAAASDPFDNLDFPCLVELVDFEVGVMDKKNREGQSVGAQVWYRCSQVRPVAASPRTRQTPPAKSEDAA